MTTPAAGWSGEALRSSISATRSTLSSSSSMPCFSLARYLYGDGVAAPFLDDQAGICQLLFYKVYVGVGPVYLVDGDDDGHLGGPGVVDGLYRLRHDAVVSGHHQDGHVGDIGAVGAHGGESLVAGVSRKVILWPLTVAW